MGEKEKILRELTRIQERTDVLEHHKESVFEGITLAEAHCID